jgi:16S rRNA (guanine966-N2)-methyltransferase
MMKKKLLLTGGSFTGRRLYVPETGVRPATNMVREAVFSTLRGFLREGVEGSRVLDLFAGSGSLGLEALSRGAALAVFVDKGRNAVRSITRNLEILGFSDPRRALVIAGDAAGWLKRNRDLRFDVVFVDPPYRYAGTGGIVELLKGSLAAGSGALLVYERFFDADPPDFGEGAELLKRKKYGQSEILYYRLYRCATSSA